MAQYYYVDDIARILDTTAVGAREVMRQEDFPSSEDEGELRVGVDAFNEWLEQYAYSHHSYEIELVTVKDVTDFVNAVDGVEGDVRIKGMDENGRPWEVSAKSMLLTLLAASRSQLAEARKKEGKDSAYNVDWNTLRCESTEDIYTRISKWVKGSLMTNEP